MIPGILIPGMILKPIFSADKTEAVTAIIFAFPASSSSSLPLCSCGSPN